MGNLTGGAGLAMSRAASGAASFAVTVIALAAVVEVARQPTNTPLDRGLPSGVLLVAGGALVAVVAGAWLLRAAQPAVPIGLAAVMIGLCLPLLGGLTSLSPTMRAAALAAPPLATAGTAHVALRWMPISRGASHALCVVWLLVAGAVVVHIVGYDPFDDPVCARTCVGVDPALSEYLTTRQSQEAAGLLTLAASVVAVIGLTCVRGRVPRVVVAGVAVATTLLALESGTELGSDGSLGPWLPSRVLIPATAALAVGVATTVVGIRLRRVRAAVDRLLSALSTAPSSDLGSPELGGVQFAEPGSGGWVDAFGRRVRDDPTDGSVVVSDAAGPLLRLSGAGSVDVEKALAGQSRASWLTLRNAQLAAVTRARVAEVQASRRRVCAASDAERRRIERDLHDGAQQRLVSATLHLSLVRGRLPDRSQVLREAETTLRDAVGDLRRLTHGLFPSLLDNEGLRAALDELVRGAEVPTTLDVGCDDRMGTDAALAVYAMVAAVLDEAARPPRATRGRVTVERRDGLVLVQVKTHLAGDDHPAPDYIEIDDRVGALGGLVRVAQVDGLSTVTAEIPCGS